MAYADRLRGYGPHSLTIPMAPQWKRHPENPYYLWNVVTREVVLEDELQRRMREVAIKAIMEESTREPIKRSA